MVKETSDIKMWAALTAQVSVAYSIICIGLEIIAAADLFTMGMLVIWFILYLINIWINLVFSGKCSNWGKSDIIIWFAITTCILIIRLACTNYSHLSIGVWVFTIIVNIYMLFVLFVIFLLGKKMDNPTTDIRSSLTSDPDNNIIISATAVETNIEDLSDNLRSAIGSYHSNLHNDSPSGGVIGSRCSNINCDSQIVFVTPPTLDNLNDESQNDLAIAPSYGVLNTDSQNLDRSGDINNIFNATDPPPSYDDVMNRKNEKEKK
ncbi:uncharacterized protein LOC117569836 isoform X1 [Drosophila albomicans]|uniref:Uncharacterized protein LOC117569836 isoform X1 n=1 Tax=Drosophila albomicans TaxID=7291 RepID=A0A6P8X055_DROAB|nr:uncharacterized protein LOC117569836 isoform X1 [Drosophila albomicans]